MKNLLYIFSAFSFICLSGCNNIKTTEKSGSMTLTGKLENATSVALFFEELTPSDLIPVDSIYTDPSGNFSFDLFIEDAGFYRLGINGDNFITLSIEPNEILYITGDALNLPETYEVKGSKGSAIIRSFTTQKLLALKKVDSLKAIYHEKQYEPEFIEIRKQLHEDYKEIKDHQKQFIKKTIEENPNSLSSILALYQYFDDKVLLKESEDFEYFQLLSKSLCQAYPHNKHVMDLKKRVSEHQRAEEQRKQNEKNLAIGMPAPEITLPDQSGNSVSLSSLKGKVVLIDFWAAWCPPCRQANVELADVYKNFKDKGFEIYGVSLDRTHEQWMKAVEADNISWVQVSDLRFMNSPVVNLYNVRNIPHNILLNKNGVIVAKDLGPNELETRLRELL